MKLPLNMIVAMNPERAIGRYGKIPWHVPEDLKRFKDLTMGHAIIMGRKTFESIGKVLPGRRSIVVSRYHSNVHVDVDTYPYIQKAIDAARVTDPQPFIIGGGQVYAWSIPFATTLHVTWVEGYDCSGSDVFFPEIDPKQFEEVHREPAKTPGVTFARYERIGDPTVPESIGPPRSSSPPKHS